MEFSSVQYACFDVFVNDRFAATVYVTVDPLFTEGIFASSFSNGEHDIYLELIKADESRIIHWVKQHLNLRNVDRLTLV